MNNRYQEFLPKSVVCLREGYSFETFRQDLFAGVSVGVIALPLALAFAIGSGVAPERGLFTAIVAGFLISLLGGSRVQIGGPTGAFVVIIYAIVQKHGYDGLALATLMASLIMILMGLFRFGAFLKFIPYPVTTGFTTGIALVIFASQIKDFFGLQMGKVPPGFISKLQAYAETAHTANGTAFLVGLSTVLIFIFLRKFYPRLPAALIAVVVTTVPQFPIETIGAIPHVLPTPTLPHFSFELVRELFPDAIAIALLGAIESLLSAVVADGITGHRHRSNCELVAQGLANIGSILFGGIPATGAIARTSANIRLGAKTPVAGMLHAVTLLLLMLFLAPLAGMIPLATLAGILVVIAWNMSELPHFFEILKGQRGDSIVLVITFLLTVLIDLTVAVQVGVILAAVIFLKRMTDRTTVEVCQILRNEPEDNHDDDLLLRKDIPSDVAVVEIKGPFFYSIADLLDETLLRQEKQPRLFILRLHQTPLIDATALQSLKKFHQKCQQRGILFRVTEINKHLNREKIEKAIGAENIFEDLETAL